MCKQGQIVGHNNHKGLSSQLLQQHLLVAGRISGASIDSMVRFGRRIEIENAIIAFTFRACYLASIGPIENMILRSWMKENSHSAVSAGNCNHKDHPYELLAPVIVRGACYSFLILIVNLSITLKRFMKLLTNAAWHKQFPAIAKLQQ